MASSGRYLTLTQMTAGTQMTPSPATLDSQLLSNDKKLAGYDHTYMKKFTQNINYCSDSQGRWLYDTPEKIIKKSINKKDFKLQLLIHPIWWNIKNYKTPQKKISSF